MSEKWTRIRWKNQNTEPDAVDAEPDVADTEPDGADVEESGEYDEDGIKWLPSAPQPEESSEYDEARRNKVDSFIPTTRRDIREYPQ